MTLQKLFLTFFGSGLSPKAPGTAGSLAALIVGVLIIKFLGTQTLFMLAIAITIIGILEINKYEQTTGSHDNPQIVIDEVSGMWISMFIAYETAVSLDNQYGILIAYLLSFIFFRLFDIWKPSTIGWIDREVKGGLGVMVDDVLAGIAGGLLSAIVLMVIEKII
ncbi:MAG: phosphatidylglycerophosphatase A [Sulfurovaceae bacterium]|nr:phosphatidylglycerophosphatase A [Sulfurovaceae bacterium]